MSTNPEVTTDLTIFEKEMAEHEVPCECECHEDTRPAVAYWFTHCDSPALCTKCELTIAGKLVDFLGKVCGCVVCGGVFVMGPAHYRRLGSVK